MPFPASSGHYKLWEKLDHHKKCPKDAIKVLAKDTRENLKSYSPEVEKSLGESAAMLLPKTIPNHLPNAGNYCAFWFIRYLTGCDRSRSLGSDNMLLIAAVLFEEEQRRAQDKEASPNSGVCASWRCHLSVSRAVCSHCTSPAGIPLQQHRAASWDAQCPRGTCTGCHFDGNRHCAVLNLQRPPLPLSLFLNITSLPLFVSLGRRSWKLRVRSSSLLPVYPAQPRLDSSSKKNNSGRVFGPWSLLLWVIS